MGLSLQAIDVVNWQSLNKKLAGLTPKLFFCFILVPSVTIEFILHSLLGNRITGVNLVLNDRNIVIL